MYGYGVIGIYKVDFGFIKNVIIFGVNVWVEKFFICCYGQFVFMINVFEFFVCVGVNIIVILFVFLVDYGLIIGNGGWNCENNLNDYYFVVWQGFLFENCFKLNVVVNCINIKFVQYDVIVNMSKIIEVFKIFLMFGVMFDVIKQVFVFVVYFFLFFFLIDKNSFSQ